MDFVKLVKPFFIFFTQRPKAIKNTATSFHLHTGTRSFFIGTYTSRTQSKSCLYPHYHSSPNTLALAEKHNPVFQRTEIAFCRKKRVNWQEGIAFSHFATPYLNDQIH